MLVEATAPAIHPKANQSTKYLKFGALALCLLSLVIIQPVLAGPEHDGLNLTEEEHAWLDKHPEVLFTGDPNWLPYEAFTAKGEYIGIVSEHLKLIEKSTGLTFKMSPSVTWTESTIKAKQGQVDILSETDDSDLKSHLNFTSPYLANPIVIAMGIKENYVESIDHIQDKRIALIRDYGYASKIRRKYSHIDFVTVDNIQDGLISVSTGKIDALLCTLALCSYTIHELGLSDVKITGKTEFDTKLALGVQKDQKELLGILNKAIQFITEGEQQLILDKWIKHDYVEKVDHTFTFIITAFAVILISIFVIANRRLTKEIDLRKKIEEQLKATIDNNERYRFLFHESAVGHAVNRLSTGEFVSVNPCFEEITGYTLKELNELSHRDLTPDNYEQEEDEQLRILQETGSYGPYEKHYIHKDGHKVAVRLNGSIVNDPSGEKLILSVVEDISAFAEAKEKLKLSSLVLENSSEAMLITDENNKIIAANPAYSQITGYTVDEVLGKDPGHSKSQRHDAAFYQDMWQEIKENGEWQGEIWDRRKDGEVYAKWLTIDTIKNRDGSIYRYVALFSDITEKKLSEEIIWKQANFDSVTGLPNRNYFYNRLRDEMHSSQAKGESFAIMLLDLDHFKDVNDTLGHDMGDLLLKRASERIPHSIRKSDTIARLGGDEFVIILPTIKNENAVEKIASSLIKKLAEPYHLEGEMAHISASIGITFFPKDASTSEALLKNADQAMYAAKNQGRNRFSYFTQSLQEDAQKRLRLSNDLRKAVDENQFELYFQPIIDLNKNRIHKAEALIRWAHPSRGMVPPLDFIPLAEDMGIIAAIGDWVCKEANKLQEQWEQECGLPIQISVNMSPIQFKEELEQFSQQWLPTDDNHHQKLVIEITEGLLLNAESEILDKLYLLRDAGYEVAIDDFGTGYSSLSYLREFDIDYLKIDKSFIQNLETDENDRALAEAIIVMAHKLGLKVIAEGVETEAQQAILHTANCDFAQGYLYSKPLSQSDFTQYLTESSAPA